MQKLQSVNCRNQSINSQSNLTAVIHCIQWMAVKSVVKLQWENGHSGNLQFLQWKSLQCEPICRICLNQLRLLANNSQIKSRLSDLHEISSFGVKKHSKVENIGDFKKKNEKFVYNFFSSPKIFTMHQSFFTRIMHS